MTYGTSGMVRRKTEKEVENQLLNQLTNNKQWKIWAELALQTWAEQKLDKFEESLNLRTIVAKQVS